MAKIIKNQKSPAADIELKDVGVTVFASGQYTLNNTEILLWSDAIVLSPASQLVTLINAGDIVVNNGSGDLNAVDGIRFLQHPDRATVQIGTTDIVKVVKVLNFDGDVAVLQSAPGEATITIGESGTAIGKALEFEFSSTGLTINKWLSVGHPSVDSEDVPFVAEWAGKAIGFSFSNKNDNADIDLEFYVNAVLQHTWEVRGKRTAFNVLAAGFFTVAQGDRISVFARDVSGGIDPRDIAGEVVALINTMPDGEGGQENGD